MSFSLEGNYIAQMYHSYNELIENGVGAYLKNPEGADPAKIYYE